MVTTPNNNNIKRLVDVNEVQRTLALIAEPGQVFEMRALKAMSRDDNPKYNKPRTINGFFDDHAKLVEWLPYITSATGIYITINPCPIDLLAYTKNRLRGQDVKGAQDEQIVARRFLLLDLDPDRAGGIAGIPSNDSEHAAALTLAANIRDTLTPEGWPAPIEIDSGNGAYLVYNIDLPSNDDGLVQRVLAGLAQRFDTDQVHIDQTTFNQSRIMRLPGTLNCKGDGSEDRPHRFAKLLAAPVEKTPVPIALLEAAALPKEQSSVPDNNKKSSPIEINTDLKWLLAYLDKYQYSYSEPKPYKKNNKDGVKIQLDECPFCKETDAAFVYYFSEGGYGYTCNHNRCKNNHWIEFRKLCEPNAYDKPDDTLPVVMVVGQQYRDMGEQALKAMYEGIKAKPFIFVKAGELVRVARDERGDPILQTVGIAEIRNVLTRTANYFRTKKIPDSDEVALVPTSPPKELAEYILAMDPSTWPFPSLTGIVEMPIMRLDGSVLDTPGYDAETHLYYVANKSMKKCKVPHTPTQKQMVQAVELINKCIGEFPYEDKKADYANMFALLITLVTRYMYDGDVMTALINATKQGTGKSLLAQFACILASGRPPAMTNFPAKEEETKKVIDSKVLAGVHTIVFDNIKRKFQSSSLDMLSTCRGYYSVRPLGQTKDITVYTQTTVIATGNNVQMDSDQARRCYEIKLVSQVSNPDERTDITIKDLDEYAMQHRADLVAALLTIVRSWYVDGKPQVENKLQSSSFGRWAGTVGSILAHAGIEGFQENRGRLKAEANTDEQQIADFLHTWYELHKDYISAVTILDYILTDVNIENKIDTENKSSGLLNTLPDDLRIKLFDRERKKQSMIQVFTNWLAGRLKTPYGPENLRIENTLDTVKRQKIWRVNTGGTGGTGGQSNSYADGKKDLQKTSQIADGEQPFSPPVPPVPPVNSAGSQTSLPAVETDEEEIEEFTI